MHRQRQGGQLIGAGAQHIIRHGAGKERIEEAEQLRIARKQGSGLADAIRRVFGFFSFGGNGWRSSRSWKPREKTR
jgi:hypothetical protein